MTRLVILATGWSSTIQDPGRPGLTAFGLTAAGPIDPGRAAVVNRLVGNPPDAAVIETYGGLVVEATGPMIIATTRGAGVISLRADERYMLEPDPSCNYGYLAVRGGLDVTPVLGSRSTDTLAGVGPAPIAVGTEFDIGPDPATPILVDEAPLAPHRRLIDLWPGPHTDEIADLDRLVTGAWSASSERSRTGLRLDGDRLRRRTAGEIEPVGLVPGAVQLPPDGRPVVLLRDHPVTGGYPVVAVIDPDHLADLAQCPAGERLRFRWVG